MRTGSRWLAAAAVVAATLTAVGAPTSAQTTTDPAEAAAGWLGRQFVDGDHLETVFDGTAFPDTGLTIDGVLGLTAAGVGGDTVDAAMDYLVANAAGYVGDGSTESYAGSLAKLALVAQAQGADPSGFGGIDLISRLQERQAESGRFSDLSEFGDFSNGITQSLAVLALDRQGVDEPAQAGAAYLIDQQCPDGGFPDTLEQETCTSLVDATAYAVQALLAVGEGDAAAAAVDFLEGRQAEDGGFENANGTGLAAAALASAGSTAAATEAVTFLRGLQQGCSAEASVRGAIAFDDSGLDDRAIRATSQALLGLTGADLATLSASDTVAPDLPTLDCTAPNPTSTTTTTSSTTSSSTSSTSTTAEGSTTSTPDGTTTTLPPSPPAGPPITSLSRTTVPAGGTLDIDEPGFPPGAIAAIVLWSDPVRLATVPVGTDGRVVATVAIPTATPPGAHTIGILAGDVVKVSPITVTAPAGDTASGGEGELPTTGAGIASIVPIGAGLILAGAIAAGAARLRRNPSAL